MSSNPREDDVEVAELQQALLDDATLEALLGDVAALCEIEGITFKSSSEAHAEAGTRPQGLTAVREALERGVAVQLRYAYRGERWCDTLLPGITDTLLVRTRWLSPD